MSDKNLWNDDDKLAEALPGSKEFGHFLLDLFYVVLTLSIIGGVYMHRNQQVNGSSSVAPISQAYHVG